MKHIRKKIMTALLALYLGMSGCLFNAKEKTVGEEIRMDDITEFYYTTDASTNPPHFQRYRFYVEDGKHAFYHEKRQGDHWPLTESDVTVCGTLDISMEEWLVFYECLEDGIVTQREENLEAGNSGPWLYLYWKNDASSWQVFSFSSYVKQQEFVSYCENLRDRQMNQTE